MIITKESYRDLIGRGWTRHEAFEEILRKHPPRKTSRPGDIVVLMVHFGLHGGQYCYLSEDDIYSPGDLVEVSVSGQPQVVTVDAVGYYSEDEYPFGDLFVRTINGPASGDLAAKYREAIGKEAQKICDIEKIRAEAKAALEEARRMKTASETEVKQAKELKQRAEEELDEANRALEEAKRAKAEAEAAREALQQATQQLIETALTGLEDKITKVTKKANELLEEDDLSDYIRKEIGKLYTEYLPQTVSLIGAYRELFQADFPLTEIEKIRNAILDAISKSNDAYDAILHSLYLKDTITLYSEVEALKALFAMDGLTKPDFDIHS